jgi:hypothetical protein
LFFDIISERERELGSAQGEIKAFRATEALKDKAIEEVLRKSGEKKQFFCSSCNLELTILLFHGSSSGMKLVNWIRNLVSQKIL